MSTERLKGLLSLDNDEETVVSLPINKLEFIENSPFKIYGGERKAKLIESLRDRLISPIVVMPSENRGHYKILCGANRVDAYKQLGYEEIKSTIINDISEDEAMLIMVESNLFNRSVDDMLPSELGKSLLIRQQAMKRQGERTDLKLVTSGTMYQRSEENTVETSGTMYRKLEEEYKLSERNIRNYIRLTYLCVRLLDYVDNNVVPFRSGVELSYLRNEEQIELSELIKAHNYHISINIAETLKKLSQESEKSIDIKSVMDGIMGSKPDKAKDIKINVKDISEYIPTEDIKNAKEIIIKALKLFYLSGNV